MSESEDWEIPKAAQPRQDELGFDLQQALSSIVAVRTEIPEDGFTVGALGTERAGNGVIIRDDGLVLTIGYLIMEAETVWLQSEYGIALPAHIVGYDQESGFGLLQALGKLPLPALEIGSSNDSEIGDPVIIAGQGGQRHSLKAHLIGKREFAGYWEYLLEEAVFTAPAHPNWGGAAMIGQDGRLQGIGSLFVQQVQAGNQTVDGNMIVPIDLLPPIIDEMLTYGRVLKPPRPWLGLYAAEAEDKLVVAGLARRGPAEQADVRTGDIIVAVADQEVAELGDFLRKVWSRGEAGTEIPLVLAREGGIIRIDVPSAARRDYLKGPKVH